MELTDFAKISDSRWKLPKDKDSGMNVDADIFASEEILQNAVSDNSIQQVINVSSLPGIISNSIAMPDIHYGYGFCIGGVAAFPAEDGIVLPGGVGYDINCGVRLLTTGIEAGEIEKHKDMLGHEILRDIPTGLTKQSSLKLNKKEFLRVLKNGAEEIVNAYSGDKEDLKFIESGGKLDFDSPEVISQRAIERGRPQVGSLGAGNHFIEIQYIDKIFDESAAEVFGLKQGCISFMIHTGSRGFGHQIAGDYIERIRKKNLHRIKVRDPQLIYAEIKSTEGRQYLQALNAASNFAYANRHLLMERLISIFERVFSSSKKNLGIKLVYDQAHNIAKFEKHIINGREENVLVHRKGATRAFPPGHRDVPREYRKIGQPVLIPGSMGTSSYVLRGTEKAMAVSLGSSAHGAGRKMSRHKAIKFSADIDVREKLKKDNILAFSLHTKGLREEIPEAYKEIDDVIKVTEGAGISQKVARLIPLVVIKG
jgi:tRNA-splicing ligase RtcB